ncbi:hypothetical protein HPP92_010636 [Vanilla planifolia]|uniref:Uncharacterized protein n=1 Tax=Vanilla planifolia TaxID=51239 RepID=A0A835R4H5_VANPL|nr:hypothetical protein HPP92_010636 [Vanilla planifolia]
MTSLRHSLLYPPPFRSASILSVPNSSFSCVRSAFVHPVCSSSSSRHRCSVSVLDGGIPEEDGSEPVVQDLRVPEAWLVPAQAHEESEWLRTSLHKWLDDEFCPEPTNFEISKVAARSYHESLLLKQTDLGEILLKMASELETISYQQSFHGPFSSANAAVQLITQRIDSSREK